VNSAFLFFPYFSGKIFEIFPKRTLGESYSSFSNFPRMLNFAQKNLTGLEHSELVIIISKKLYKNDLTKYIHIYNVKFQKLES
jgi:hypothetical protein